MPSSKPKDSTHFRQTTLFDAIGGSSGSSMNTKPERRTRKKKNISKPEEKQAFSDDSEELAAIRFNPAPASSSPVRDDHESEEEEEEEEAPRPLRRKRLIRHSDMDSDSEQPLDKKAGTHLRAQSSDEEGQEDRPKKKSRIQRRHHSETIVSSDEDIAELANEVDEDRILDSRLRERNKTKSEFQRNLELLKRRKLKLSAETSTKDAEESPSSESDEESSAKLIKGSKPTRDYDDDDADTSSATGESDFIVEDDNDTAVQLPPEFSMETHENVAHQFKKIFQFFVHVAVQPPKARADYMKARIKDEQYFSVPLQVMRRKLLGLRDSLAASSVWRPEFKQALEKYPEFELVQLDFAVPQCDACHLGGRVSTLLGRLSGLPYDDSGFKSRPKKRNNPPEFHLGRFCARRTKVYHDFSHWEHDLFQSISREISSLHESTSQPFHRVAYAGAAEPPDNLQDADGLCDWLDSRRFIDMEWHKIKTMMESARNLELDHKRGDVDD